MIKTTETRNPSADESQTDLLRNRRLRILLVSADLPYPPNWGFAKRVFELSRTLSHRHHVTVLSYRQDTEAAAAEELARHVDELVTVRKRSNRGINKRLRQALMTLSSTPYHASALRNGGLQTALDGLVATQEFDIVQLESSQLGWLRVPGDIPVVVDEHNVESELLARMCQSESSHARRQYNRLEAWRYRRYEERVWARAAGCAATSTRDAREVAHRQPEAVTAVVPNGVDCDQFRPTGAPRDPASLVFVGLLAYRPNLDGVEYLLDSILPRIRQVRPDVRLTIVGGGDPEVLDQLRGPGVEVTGWVPDVRPYLASASVAVVPLRIGGGTRLKLVDALAMGTPVVSTSLGAEGIDVVDGEHVRLADDAEAFARAATDLMSDKSQSAQLSRAGRQLVVEEYSWEQSVAELERLYRELLEDPAQGGVA